jgi:hypothetical protein
MDNLLVIDQLVYDLFQMKLDLVDILFDYIHIISIHCVHIVWPHTGNIIGWYNGFSYSKSCEHLAQLKNSI